MPVVIRPIEPAYHAATRALAEAAFASGDIGEFIDDLRRSGCLLGEWLAEDENGAIGYVAFARVFVDSGNGRMTAAAQLAPLAVLPGRQRAGIGTRLTCESLRILEQRGERLFLVVGHTSFYSRFGFRTVEAGEIDGPWTGKSSFMVRGDEVPVGRLVLPDVIANAP